MSKVIDKYLLYEMVGSGAYGKVYRAVNKQDKLEYAVKVIDSMILKNNKKLSQYTINQVKILKHIEYSPHIIHFYDMIKSSNNFYFIYQFCNGGTLAQYIQKNKYLKQAEALIIFKQLLNAFKTLRINGVVHRDLKPQNILFKDGIVKLGDFGFCKKLLQEQLMKSMIGSPFYMAPEILNGASYTNNADIWSIGVVLYEMLYGYCPFQSTTVNKLINTLEICEVGFQQDRRVSIQTKQYISRMLTKDPKKRISWQSLFEIQINDDGKYAKNLKNKDLLNLTKRVSSQTHFMRKPLALKNIVSVKNLRICNSPENDNNQSRYNFHVKKKLNTDLDHQTDDQSFKGKLFRKQIQCIKTPDKSLKKNFSSQQKNKNMVFAKVSKPFLNLQSKLYDNQAIKRQYKNITNGLAIGKKISATQMKYGHLYSELILIQVQKRLQLLLKKFLGITQLHDTLIEVKAQLEGIKTMLKNLKQRNPQNQYIIQQCSNSLKETLAQMIPQSNNPKLCYEMVCYLLKIKTKILSNNEEKKRQLERLLRLNSFEID